MATASFTTPGTPLTMAALKTFLDAALGELLNRHRGASAPDSPVEGQLWWDTSGGATAEILKRYTVEAGWVSILTMNVTTGTITAIHGIKDEDDMASDSAVLPPSQQSVKAYVDSASASAVQLCKQVFTSSGTFTIPANATASTVFKFTITGGGAGEYYGTGNYSLGGGAGATAIKWLSGFKAGQTITVTVGAGGAADSGAGHGGASTISSGTATITTVTGGGGLNNGTGGTASNGDVNIAGGRGQGIGSFTNGLIGGSSIYGSAGAYGSGGGYNTENSTGRAGTAGIVIVEWVLN